MGILVVDLSDASEGKEVHRHSSLDSVAKCRAFGYRSNEGYFRWDRPFARATSTSFVRRWVGRVMVSSLGGGR